MKPKSKGIVSWPKAERPRERLLADGAEKLTEAKLLAIILRMGQVAGIDYERCFGVL